MAENEITEILNESHASDSESVTVNHNGTGLQILQKLNEIYLKRIDEVERVEGDLEVKFETFLCDFFD